MTTPTQRPGDKMKKAICAFSELLKEHPEKNRGALLHQIEIKFDLSPKECEFLDTHMGECRKEKE